METPAISTTKLTKFYGSRRGIENVDLDIAPGEVFGFLGPNGAGKTTTIRLFLDLLRPTMGRACILGRDCRRESLAVRRRVGYLPGEFQLYENLDGRRLIAYLGGLGGEVDPVRVRDLAGRLQAELDRPIRTLSHGNKQKLAILLAFLHRPPVLILDEPTSGLDPLMQQEFFGLIDEGRREGRTVFLSSHNLPEVEKVCDRVGSIRNGRLVAVEKVADLRSAMVRVVELFCEREPALSAFADLPGLGDLVLDGRRIGCTLQGPIGQLLDRAGPFGIVDLLSRRPTLEEFFLAMYGEGGSGHDRQHLPQDPR